MLVNLHEGAIDFARAATCSMEVGSRYSSTSRFSSRVIVSCRSNPSDHVPNVPTVDCDWKLIEHDRDGAGPDYFFQIRSGVLCIKWQEFIVIFLFRGPECNL
jgi:hypothetical protein